MDSPLLFTPESTEYLAPLVMGTILLERYTVRTLIAHEPEHNVYRVGEARLCPVCGVENDGGTDVCGFCANALPAPLELVLTEQRAPASLRGLPPTSFIS